MIYNAATTTQLLEEAVSVFDNRYGDAIKFAEPPTRETEQPIPKADGDFVRFLWENNITSVGDLIRLLQNVGTG